MAENGNNIIDIYPVGLLHDLQFLRGVIQNFGRHTTFANVRTALRKLMRGFRRSWRRHSYWNGYLAEHPTMGRRCGHGWTKRRAYRDLIDHLTDEIGRREGSPDDE